MPQLLKSDPANGVGVAAGSVFFSLGSTHWQNLTGGSYAAATFDYSPPGGKAWADGEMATMNMANWGGEGKWYSAKRRLNLALGYGTYEQSLKVGVGSGVTTTFYLSEAERDRFQEIDFEFSGHCGDQKPCGTQFAWTNVWREGSQYGLPSPLGAGAPDTTSGWGFTVYRYKITWEPDAVTWSVDIGGKGDRYVDIRTQPMGDYHYVEALCYPFISFWTGWTPDNSPFTGGSGATHDCGTSGRCYQAYYFQPLRFTPSGRNKQVTLG